MYNKVHGRYFLRKKGGWRKGGGTWQIPFLRPPFLLFSSILQFSQKSYDIPLGAQIKVVIFDDLVGGFGVGEFGEQVALVEFYGNDIAVRFLEEEVFTFGIFVIVLHVLVITVPLYFIEPGVVAAEEFGLLP